MDKRKSNILRKQEKPKCWTGFKINVLSLFKQPEVTIETMWAQRETQRLRGNGVL